MTREEAIEMLNKDKEQRGDCFISEALDMAIKALEQEPCEDCVSRKAVLDIINNPLNIRLEEIIEKLPYVTPKGVTVTDFADRCRECGREKVLDKIRSEIEEYKDFAIDCDGESDLGIALQVIDKYKAESEDRI